MMALKLFYMKRIERNMLRRGAGGRVYGQGCRLCIEMSGGAVSICTRLKGMIGVGSFSPDASFNEGRSK